LYFNLIDINNLGVFIFLGMASAFVVVVRSPATGIILILEMTWDFTLLPSMVIVAGLAYTVSNLLGVEPIYDRLYKPLIEKDDNDEVVELVFEVGSESYLIGEEIGEIKLPGNLKIKSIERRGEIIKIDDTTPIEKNDIIGVPTKKRDIEKFYDSLRSLAQEN
ncbi:TrkA C-terminal domain-containing protein, partial [Cetobacterium sp.]